MWIHHRPERSQLSLAPYPSLLEQIWGCQASADRSDSSGLIHSRSSPIIPINWWVSREHRMPQPDCGSLDVANSVIRFCEMCVREIPLNAFWVGVRPKCLECKMTNMEINQKDCTGFWTAMQPYFVGLPRAPSLLPKQTVQDPGSNATIKEIEVLSLRSALSPRKITSGPKQSGQKPSGKPWCDRKSHMKWQPCVISRRKWAVPYSCPPTLSCLRSGVFSKPRHQTHCPPRWVSLLHAEPFGRLTDSQRHVLEPATACASLSKGYGWTGINLGERLTVAWACDILRG